MKKSVIIVLCLVSLFFGMLIGSAGERSFIIKSARLVKVTDSGYSIAYGNPDCNEVHEYEY